MGTLNTLVTVAGATIIGAAGYEVYKRLNADQKAQHGSSANRVMILEETFGAPMHTGTFTLNEAVTWLKEHLHDDCQGVIFRADCSALKSYAPKLNQGMSMENYLVMAIVDKTSRAMRDRVLVKFEVLDTGLKDALGGEGMLVIET